MRGERQSQKRSRQDTKSLTAFCYLRAMGKNKLAKFDDMAGYPHVFQYPFAALQEQGFAMKGHWNEQFFHNDHPIVLELGCGKGEYTVGLGQLFPEKNFIGGTDRRTDLFYQIMQTGCTLYGR